MIAPRLIGQIRNVPVRELVAALGRDGVVARAGKGSSRVHRHSDGRRTVIYDRCAGDALPLGTLRKVSDGAGWADDQIRRPKPGRVGR